jgi:hypothetical protein
MAHSLQLRASRALPLARDCTDTNLRERLLMLAEEYAARAGAREDGDRTVWQAGSDDQDD